MMFNADSDGRKYKISPMHHIRKQYNPFVCVNAQYPVNSIKVRVQIPKNPCIYPIYSLLHHIPLVVRWLRLLSLKFWLRYQNRQTTTQYIHANITTAEFYHYRTSILTDSLPCHCGHYTSTTE